MKILVVEDDKNLNKAICDMIKKIAETDSIYDGEEAMFAVERNIYDLIINTDSFDPESISEIVTTTLKVI